MFFYDHNHLHCFTMNSIRKKRIMQTKTKNIRTHTITRIHIIKKTLTHTTQTRMHMTHKRAMSMRTNDSANDTKKNT